MSNHEGPGLSLVIPVYMNEGGIDDLVAAIADFDSRYAKFEAVIVVDGSPDASWDRLRDALRSMQVRSQLVLLSRNFGAFAAIRQGLELARYEVIAVMAADLQEPPELIDRFYAELSAARADIAVGVRTKRADGPVRHATSRLFWALYRRFVLQDVPRGGVDIFAVTERVRSVLVELQESNSSLVAQLFWMGFRRVEVPYERLRRRSGRSAWTRRKRLQYMLDSVISFSELPIKLLLWLGVLGVMISTVAATVVVVSWWMGRIAVPGYTPVILGVLFFGSLLMIGQGIVGAYVWRAAENTKRRPLSIIAAHEEFGPMTAFDHDGKGENR